MWMSEVFFRNIIFRDAGSSAACPACVRCSVAARLSPCLDRVIWLHSPELRLHRTISHNVSPLKQRSMKTCEVRERGSVAADSGAATHYVLT